MMSEECKDTEIEPKLTPLSGEELQARTSTIQTRKSQISGLEVSGYEGNRHFTTYGFLTPTPAVIATSAGSSAML